MAHIASVYETSLTEVLALAETPAATLADLEVAAEVLGERVRAHGDTVHRLARGMAEARRYLGPEDMNRFVAAIVGGRITSSLVTEQFLALFAASWESLSSPEQGESQRSESSRWIGLIDRALKPADIIRDCEALVGDITEFRYGVRPTVEIKGSEDYAFAQIPGHLEYIITELLKNAFRAVLERRLGKAPVEVTIAPLPESPDDAKGGEFTQGVTIRIRDQGGGIPPEVLKNIWDFSFTTFNEDHIQSALLSEEEGEMDSFSVIANNAGGSTLAGLGYGLPLGRAYAEYFGGSIEVVSMWGWGTDVYLSLKGIGGRGYKTT
jgi:signal transduction histidine kinase